MRVRRQDGVLPLELGRLRFRLGLDNVRKTWPWGVRPKPVLALVNDIEGKRLFTEVESRAWRPPLNCCGRAGLSFDVYHLWHPPSGIRKGLGQREKLYSRQPDGAVQSGPRSLLVFEAD